MLLPDQPGKTYPHLLVQAGKEGTIDLVNRDNMGHFHSGNDSQIVQTMPFAIGGIWGAPAFWNNNVYFGGKYDYLKAFSFDPNAQRFSTSYTSKSPSPSAFLDRRRPCPRTATPMGLCGSLRATITKAMQAILRAYDATNLGNELYNSEQNSARDRVGSAVEFTTPTIADGLVFAGAVNQVSVYGLLVSELGVDRFSRGRFILLVFCCVRPGPAPPGLGANLHVHIPPLG